MKETLLTAPLTPEQEALQRRIYVRIDKAETVALDIWLQGYLVGDVSLERMSREVRASLVRIGVSDRARCRILGEMLDKVAVRPEPKRGRGKKGYPVALKKTSPTIVDLVVEREGLPKTRSGTKKTKSAFERAAEVLEECGFEVTPETLIKWYTEWRDSVG
ncbi:MAG: hypothetical protein NBV55_03285 [Polynucleobacter sp.]|nr:hypothetical protein [Polynucleobacter sp.]